MLRIFETQTKSYEKKSDNHRWTLDEGIRTIQNTLVSIVK